MSRLYLVVLWVELALAPLTALVLLFLTAPYGRHERRGWGPRITNRLGWMLMEGVSLTVFAVTFVMGEHARQAVPMVFLAAWLTHYLYRSVVYPQMMRSGVAAMPLVIALSGMTFNLMNAWLNARWVSALGTYDRAWAGDPRFILGLALMICGFLLHLHSDSILIGLRGPGERGYRIPERGLHCFIANPNYLGEIIQWSGWALATWSPAGLAFALFTVANLAPRARANLRWYRARFPAYPARRKALLPGIF